MEKRSCAVCDADLPAAQPVGRPGRYCTAGCRRVAEYALRRASSLLLRAEQRWQDAGQRLAIADPYLRSAAEAELAFWESERQRRSAELAALLRGSGKD